MREIWRGKRKDNGEWVEGYLLPHKVVNEAFIVPTGMGVFKDEKIDGKYHVYAFEVVPETVGQYTGKDDIDGEWIFDGDIVVDTNKNRFSNRPHIVALSPEMGYWMLNDSREPKIVGNIHDNPTLVYDYVTNQVGSEKR